MPPPLSVASTKPGAALGRGQGWAPWQGRGWSLAPRDRGREPGMDCLMGHALETERAGEAEERDGVLGRSGEPRQAGAGDRDGRDDALEEHSRLLRRGAAGAWHEGLDLPARLEDVDVERDVDRLGTGERALDPVLARVEAGAGDELLLGRVEVARPDERHVVRRHRPAVERSEEPTSEL